LEGSERRLADYGKGIAGMKKAAGAALIFTSP
jgi:hypothetical protein